MRRAAGRHLRPRVSVAPTSDVMGCSGKKQYPTFADASHVSQLIRRNKDGERVQPYRCRQCQHYHVGGMGDHQLIRARNKR